MEKKKHSKGPQSTESDMKGQFYIGRSDQGMASKKEIFEHMTEGSQGMSHVNLREGRVSSLGKTNAKALRGRCVENMQDTSRRPVCPVE